MITPTEALDRLREAADSGELARFCQNRGVEFLVVFGSTVAEQELRPPEDLDVAVRLDARGDLVDVVNGLIDLTGTDDVDLMDLGQAGVVARARALGPGCLPLYEAGRGAYARAARAQMAALTEAMETAPLRRLDLELLAER